MIDETRVMIHSMQVSKISGNKAAIGPRLSQYLSNRRAGICGSKMTTGTSGSKMTKTVCILLGQVQASNMQVAG